MTFKDYNFSTHKLLSPLSISDLEFEAVLENYRKERIIKLLKEKNDLIYELKRIDEELKVLQHE